MATYLLSIDQGTTSSRAIIFDTHGRVCATAQQEFEQHFPQDGWVEHQPEQIWQSVLETCQQAIKQANITGQDIAGIGITNQRETSVIWDKNTGDPIYNAIVWQDRRTADYCDALKKRGLEEKISKKTGLLLDPYFSASKINWLLNSVPGAREKAQNDQLRFGTIDSYLLWKLTNGQQHKTDATNASRTMLFNIHQQQWDEELLEIFDIPPALLPQVCDSAADFGHTSEVLFGSPVPVAGIAGDQQAALIGQACFEAGMAKSTYGTGCFLMVNTGKNALASRSRLLTTVAYRLKGEVCYALEGSIFMAGATIQWLRDGLKLIKNAKDSEALARQIPVDHGVVMVPAFTGLGAPYWDPHARAAIFGLGRDAGVNEIASAALQSVCFQTRDLQEAIGAEGIQTKTLRVDGGMANNNWLMQHLADITHARVQRPAITETTALGVAYLAGLQVGVFSSLGEISQLWQQQQQFSPELPEEVRETLYHRWLSAVEKVRSGQE